MGGNLINKVDPVTEFLTRVQNAKDEDVEQKNDDMCSDDSDKKNASDDELLEGIRDLIEEGVPKDKIVKDIVKESGADEARIRRLVREAYSF